MAQGLFIVGLVLVALAVGGIAGPWWGVLVAGLVLAALGVLTRAAAPAAGAGSDEAGDGR